MPILKILVSFYCKVKREITKICMQFFKTASRSDKLFELWNYNQHFPNVTILLLTTTAKAMKSTRKMLELFSAMLNAKEWMWKIFGNVSFQKIKFFWEKQISYSRIRLKKKVKKIWCGTHTTFSCPALQLKKIVL